MIYVSVVSHHHGEMISSINFLSELGKNSNLQVIVKDNVGEESLRNYCLHSNLDYICYDKGRGFGANNNLIFEYVNKEYGLMPDDFFLVLNPDVYFDSRVLFELIEKMNHYDESIGTINLFRDSNYTQYDNSVRLFPRFHHYLLNFVFRKKLNKLDKDLVFNDALVDWAAGSFLLIKADLFEMLRGFDTKYFMYCEDVDLCWRSFSLAGKKVLYAPSLKGVHMAQHKNRSLFSKHFFWHLISVGKFFVTKYYSHRLKR